MVSDPLSNSPRQPHGFSSQCKSLSLRLSGISREGEGGIQQLSNVGVDFLDFSGLFLDFFWPLIVSRSLTESFRVLPSLTDCHGLSWTVTDSRPCPISQSVRSGNQPSLQNCLSEPGKANFSIMFQSSTWPDSLSCQMVQLGVKQGL